MIFWKGPGTMSLYGLAIACGVLLSGASLRPFSSSSVLPASFAVLVFILLRGFLLNPMLGRRL